MTADAVDLPEGIPRWGAMPVPWITRWTEEVIAGPYACNTFTDPPEIVYPGAVRDRQGVLWMPENWQRGGKPMFSQMNSARQRLAMRKMLCQVCGEQIHDRPITSWLMTKGQIISRLNLPGGLLTTNPPTCQACMHTALVLCPHLSGRKESIFRITARKWEAYGVTGEAVARDRNGGIAHKNNIIYRYGDPGARSVLAKMSAMLITEFDFEEVAR